jgi:hypothetical protein
LLILDLWGISFHAVVVFGLGKNLLFKSVLGHCDYVLYYIRIIQQEVRIIHSGLIGCFLCSNNFTLPHCNTEQKVMKISRD